MAAGFRGWNYAIHGASVEKLPPSLQKRGRLCHQLLLCGERTQWWRLRRRGCGAGAVPPQVVFLRIQCRQLSLQRLDRCIAPGGGWGGWCGATQEVLQVAGGKKKLQLQLEIKFQVEVDVNYDDHVMTKSSWIELMD